MSESEADLQNVRERANNAQRAANRMRRKGSNTSIAASNKERRAPTGQGSRARRPTRGNRASQRIARLRCCARISKPADLDGDTCR
eukprot:3971350-Pleurochrysis_carterae.AAC.1